MKDKWMPAESLDQVKKELRSAVYHIAYHMIGVDKQSNRYENLFQGGASFLQFGVRSGLINPDESNDWLDVLRANKSLKEVASKYSLEVPDLPERISNEEFLKRLYEKCNPLPETEKKKSEVIDLIFNYVNNLFKEARTEECNWLLADIDVSKLGVDALLSFLTITNWASANLPARKLYFARAWRRCLQLVGKKETKALLGGLDKYENKQSIFDRLVGRPQRDSFGWQNIMGYPKQENLSENAK
ncbi:MAG: hypothetical protein DWQ19_09935 [Crenarchaeota archaeon]|nr:MAG: hypothetical protein DWQ19_09935 [Thermoproteota archaeon]